MPPAPSAGRLVPTHGHLHRPVATDTDSAEALKVLHPQKDLNWRRQDQINLCAQPCTSITRL